ncbi:hypothetical protein DFH28DRAFT_888020, partial [Melampsora americana]
LEAGLQALENAGIVGSANRMSIAELLNPQDENPEPVVATAEQWFEAQNQMEIEAEVDDPVIPPTASEALKAVSLLIQFIESADLPEATAVDPLLPALESALTSLTYFSNKIQPSITSFFSRKK